MVVILALHAKKDATGHTRTCHDVPGSDFSFVGSTFPGATRSGQERRFWDYSQETGYFVLVLGMMGLHRQFSNFHREYKWEKY